MAAIDATSTTGASAENNPNSIIYRPIGWNDLDAVVELFDRTWPQDGELAGTETSLLISRYFVLHYLQPTTFANAAFTVDGTLAGIERGIIAHEEAAKRLERLNNAFSLELALERNSRANETTLGELELFVVNPDVRGQGVGGGLWRRMQEHFAAWNVDAFYLHTDSDCDVSFYDHKGLERIAERNAEVSSVDGAEPLFDDMFIYRGEVAGL